MTSIYVTVRKRPSEWPRVGSCTGAHKTRPRGRVLPLSDPGHRETGRRQPVDNEPGPGVLRDGDLDDVARGKLDLRRHGLLGQPHDSDSRVVIRRVFTHGNVAIGVTRADSWRVETDRSKPVTGQVPSPSDSCIDRVDAGDWRDESVGRRR